MKKRLNVSLSVKLTFIVAIVLTITISSITFLNIHVQQGLFDDAPYHKATALTGALNATIGNESNLKDFDILKNKTHRFIYSYINEIRDEILKVTICLPDENNNLRIKYSTNEDEINNYSLFLKFHKKAFDSKDDDIYYIFNEGERKLTYISRINFSGTIYGTYELTISTEKTYNIYDTRIRTLVFVSVILLFIMMFIFLYLLTKITVKPIKLFRDKAKKIGKGELETRVEIKNRDELGELAKAFNQMAIDLKESRDKIQDYNDILENLIDQKDEFIGQLGHDLKNPLQPLVGLLPMLIKKEKDPDIKEALVIMNKNVEYMRNLIFETLQLAKLRSSDIKFNMEDINLKEEAENAIDTQKLLLKENKIKIKNKIDKKIIVYADKLRLSEVFKNLIANSVKYTPDTGGTITIDAEIDKKMVKVKIKDTGIGMTKEQLKKVFDEFYKVDRQTSDYHSTGLGLAICKRIVEKLGGRIWVESQGAGKGSTFYFTLINKTKNN